MTALPAPAPGGLRAPGRIVLLSCYELGHAPMGLASPAGFLQAAGFRPALQDLATERLDAERVAHAGVVGISVPMHTALRLGLRAAERVRALNPNAFIVCYGLYAGLNAELLLGGAADAVVGGEYEPPLVALAEALDAGRPPELPGVSTPRRRTAPRLARTAFARPAREQLRPLADYARLEHPDGARTVGYVEATRGCKHTCLHCPLTPVYGGRFFAVPAETVLADVAAQVAQGARHITFGDPDFLNGPGHARRIVQALHARFPDVTYDVTAKVEHLLAQRALLPELARTGCAFIVTAVESLSDTVLANLDKGHTRADVEAGLRAVRAAGIAPRPTWLPFTPWTTLADYLDMLDYVAREGLVHHVDPVQYAIRLLVPPGSALLGTPQFAPFEGPLDEQALTVTWRHPDPRMDALQARVAAIVEEAAAREQDDHATFRAVYEAALDSAGRAGELPVAVTAAAGHPPAPRLSEPWFC